MAEFSNTPLAVIGMACRMPQADGLDEYWELLKEGRCTEVEIPPERFNRRLYYDPNKGVLCKSYASIACLMDYKPIDPRRCPLTPEDIAISDVAHLTICDVTADACRHAGYDPFNMSLRENVGVYIGHVKASELGGEICFANQIDQVAEYLREVDDIDHITGGRTESVIQDVVTHVRESRERQLARNDFSLSPHRGASLISKMLRLDGPNMVVNAACASSLQALAMGARALQLGQIDMAIIGGASYCKFDSLVLFSRAQSVSATGTRPFDANADGLVNGEGYVTLLVKTLDRAMADGDQIYALVRGIGISTDGRGKSLWAPRKEGQIAAIQRAYGSDLDMSRLQYIEAHATSTQVGDQTELQSLAEALVGQLPPGIRIPIGSVKGNVGHTIETAGMAGLLKTILSMRNATVPPQSNVRQLNPKIDWDNSPFFVPVEPVAWPSHPDGHARRAAVNSFGIGGLNVHVVLDDYSGSTAKSFSVPRTVSQPCEPIAIIGMGTVLPGARTIEALWELLESGRDAKSELPVDRWNAGVARRTSKSLGQYPSIRGGFITEFEYDWKKHKVPPKQIATADPLQFMMLDAVEQAMQMTGYDTNEFDRNRTGVCVGAISSGEYHESLQMGLRLPEFKDRLASALRTAGVAENQIESVTAKYQETLIEHMPSIIDETGSYTTNTLVSRITKAYNLMGGGAAIDSGSASGSSALTASINILQAGDCDMMICTAGQRAMGMLAYEFLAFKGLLARESDRSPFDARANGYFPGEGTGAVVLKRLSDALRDGNKVYGVVRGFGVASSDSYREAMQRAIQRCHDHAGVRPDEVNLVETAARGVYEADAQEADAMATAYGKTPRPERVSMGATTSQIGNIGAASGMVGIIKSVRALDQLKVAGNVHLHNAADHVTRHAETLQACATTSPLAVTSPDGRALAGVNSSSDDQLAYHFIVERGERVQLEASSTLHAGHAAVPGEQLDAQQDANPSGGLGTSSDLSSELLGSYRIVRLGAPTRESLIQHITQLSESLETATQVFLSANTNSFYPTDRVRMAVVVENANELHQKCRLAAPIITRPESLPALQERGIFVHELAETRPQVAFLFPGHGSQYEGMLQSLVENFAPAADVMRRIDTILKRLGYAQFREVAWDRGETLGIDVWQTQLALLVADTIALASLQALGVRPDRVSGHSFGEFPALVAAGAWTFEAAVQATYARCAAIKSSSKARGIMLSVAAGPEVLVEYAPDMNGDLHISVQNAVDQIVVGGEEEPVQALAARLKENGIVTRVLAAPCAFHTPLMEGTKAPLAKALAQIDVRPPHIPMLSSVTNKYVAEPDEIRGNLVAQMTNPVHYSELIERLVREGINVFVEVGPHQILTKLHRRILGDHDVVLIGSDQPKRSGLRQMLHVRACLECVGVWDGTSHSVDTMLSSTVPSKADKVETIAPEKKNNGQSVGLAEPSTDVGLAVLHLAGSPYEIGFQYGQTQAGEIRTILRRYADLVGIKWVRLPDIREAAAEADVYFHAEDMEELRGIADGAGVTVENMIAHNLMLYPDTGSGCVQFAVAAGSNQQQGLVHAANEDLPLALTVRGCLRRNVQVRRPAGRIAHAVFAVAGELAGINGINVHGLAVTSTMLLDLPRREESKHGRAHNAIVKSILEQAQNIDEAIHIVRRDCGSGGWSLCLSDHRLNEIAYLEYDGNHLQVSRDIAQHASTNHSHLHAPVAAAPQHSRNRLARLKSLLGDSTFSDVSIEQAQGVLRDRFDIARNRETPHPTMNTIRRVDNQMSLVMQPATGCVWIAGPYVSSDTSNTYHLLNIHQLLSASPSEAAAQESPLQVRENIKLSSVLEGDAAQLALQDCGIGPASRNGNVCYRFVMRTVETAEPESQPLTLIGPAVILGQNKVADALRRHLEQSGASAHILPSLDDVDQVLQGVDEIFRTSPAPHLFLLTPFDEDATTSITESNWGKRRRRGASTPYFVCQRWTQLLIEAGLLEQATVMAATTMGGDFGFSGLVRNAESGALTGLVKSMKIELGMKTKGRFQAKIVDVAESQSPDQIAERICREWMSDTQEIEVGYAANQRLVVRPIVQAVGELSCQEEIRTGGTWVITGGARGVTAIVARELGKRFRIKLHLIGSSPVPQIEDSWRNMTPEQSKQLRAEVMKEAVARKEVPAVAWAKVEKAIEIDRNLREFKEAGIQFTYYACDICDWDALATVLDRVRQTDGPIEGVVHGAGYESALRFEKKKRELVERTIAVKVDGAAALMDLTRQDALRYFVAFGSVSGRFGGLGQTDYGMANDMLSKLIDWFRFERPDCKSTCFHWHAWDEVGMAVRPESRHLREIGGITYMPTTEGTTHLINEIRAGAPEREVLITGWPFHKLNPEYADKVSGASRVATASPPKPRVFQPPPQLQAIVGTATSTAPPSAPARAKWPRFDHLPLVDELMECDAAKRVAVEICFDPTADPFLTQHLYKQRPILPAVIGMSAVAQAASLLEGRSTRVAVIRDIELLEPMRFYTDRVCKAWVNGIAGLDGIECVLTSDFHSRAGKLVQADRPYMRARVDLSDITSLGDVQPPLTPLDPYTAFNYPDNVVLYHGEVFRALKEVKVEGKHAWGRLISLDISEFGGQRTGDDWIIPSSAIDAAFYTCGIHVRDSIPGVAKIPKSIRSLRVGRFPRRGEQLLVFATCRELGSEYGIYDFTIYGADGSVVAIVDGYHGVFVPRGGN